MHICIKRNNPFKLRYYTTLIIIQQYRLLLAVFLTDASLIFFIIKLKFYVEMLLRVFVYVVQIKELFDGFRCLNVVF